jgi:hypothetical protein
MAVEEANCIGTAWMRLDLLPAAAQPPLREKFRQYVDARLTFFRKVPEFTSAEGELAQADSLQNQIWAQAIAACRDSGSVQANLLLVPALNEMFSVAYTRTNGLRMHPPMLIYAVLGILLLSGALLAGYGMGLGKTRDWLHALVFVLIMSVTIYFILDFEYPRVGLIRMENFDQLMIDLRKSMSN